MRRIQTDRTALALAYSPDGHFIASAGWQHVALFDLKSSDAVDFAQDSCSYVFALTFCSDNKHLAWICYAPGRNQVELRVGSLRSMRQVKAIDLDLPRGVEARSSVLSWQLAPADRDALWTVRDGHISVWNVPDLTPRRWPALRGISGQFSIWQSAAGKLLTVQSGDNEPRTALDRAESGTLIARSHGNGFEVWEIGGREPIFTQTDWWVRAVAFSPDARFLYGTSDRCISVWDTTSWTRRERFDWNMGSPECIAISPDGLTAAISGYAGEIVIWDLEE